MKARTTSAVAMQRLAARLGKRVIAGDVIGLVGDLGAGKTCFVQGLARGLGVPARERVASPTFNILLEHAGRLVLHHIDLYRIGSSDELAELGLAEVLYGGGVGAVEWLDRHPEIAPADHLEVRIAIDGPRLRTLTAVPHGARSEALAEDWLGGGETGARRSSSSGAWKRSAGEAGRSAPAGEPARATRRKKPGGG